MQNSSPALEMMPVTRLRPYAGNARTHSRKQVRQIADSIQRFGFTNPVLISDDNEIIAGHGRVMAAKELGLDDGADGAAVASQRRRAARLCAGRQQAGAECRLGYGDPGDRTAGADRSRLRRDADRLLAGRGRPDARPGTRGVSRTPRCRGRRRPARCRQPATSRRATSGMLGRHRLLCGDARSPDDVERLMAGEDVPI